VSDLVIAINVEHGGVTAMLAEPDQWDWKAIDTCVLPTMRRISNELDKILSAISTRPGHGGTNKGHAKKGKGIDLAHDAINVLRRIPQNDPFRERGFQIVEDWIEFNNQ
jgi:hypothetical protein